MPLVSTAINSLILQIAINCNTNELLPTSEHTVIEAIIASGIDNDALWNRSTQAECIVTDVFDGDFSSCMDKTVEELNVDLKDYSVLMQIQGQIRLNPTIKRNICAFLQWCKDKHRININPSTQAFPITQTAELIHRAKTQKAYMDKSKTISDTAMPSQFTDKTKWIDWYPTFLKNFLRAIPGRNSVPLSVI